MKMDIPRLVVDELLHGLDDPCDDQAFEALKAAEEAVHHPHPYPRAGGAVVVEVASETQPLLSKHYPEKPSKLRTEEDAVKEPSVDAHTPAAQVAKAESWMLVKLAVPMVLAALLEFLPDTILAMMMGHSSAERSTEVLAAYNLSGIFQMMLMAGVMNGIAAAIDTLCSQAFGAKRLSEMWMFCQAGFFVYLVCLPFAMAALWLGTPILKALGQDPTIATTAGTILAIISLSLPLTVVFSVIKSGLQAQNIAAPFVAANLVSWIITNSMAYVLAFPMKWGYVGVALAFPMAWVVKTIVLFPVLLRNKAFVQTWPGWRIREAFSLIPKISRLGVSSVLMIVFQMLGVTVISLLAGMLPHADVTISANGIFGSVLMLSSMPLMGICIAGAIRIGNALGAGDGRRASIISAIVLSSTVLLSVVGVFILSMITDKYARTFTTNKDAISLASSMISKLWPLIPLLGFTFGLQSIFRACGRQLLCAQFNFVCLFVLGVPLGILFALKLNAGLVGLWYGNMVGCLLFMLCGLVWAYRLDWQKMADEAKQNTQMHIHQLHEHQEYRSDDESTMENSSLESVDEHRQPAVAY